MVIPIPYAKEYTATLEGAVYKLVHCEKCQAEFAYEMRREGGGFGDSLFFFPNKSAQERALSKAQDDLRRRLEKECDPVPCPECGWYQEHMIPVIRRKYQFWMTIAAALLLFAGFIMSLWFLGASLSGDQNNKAWGA